MYYALFGGKKPKPQLSMKLSLKCLFVLTASLTNENHPFTGEKQKGRTSLSITILKIEAYFLFNC